LKKGFQKNESKTIHVARESISRDNAWLNPVARFLINRGNAWLIHAFSRLMRSRATMLFLIFALVILAGCPSDTPPDDTPAQNKDQDNGLKPLVSDETTEKIPLPFPIAYTSERDGNAEIYITFFENSAGINITKHESKDYGFKPFRDGGVFISQREGDHDIFYVHIKDELIFENLTLNPSVEKQMAVSCDYQKLLFTSNRDGDMEIFLYSREGFPPRNLTRNESTDSFPVWMPDGKTFLFESNRTGDWEIFMQPVDGGANTNLTNNNANEHFAQVSPDGKYMAFESDRNGAQDIYLFEFENETVRSIINDKSMDDSPVFSNDSKYIAWNHDQNGRSQICIINLNSWEISELTAPSADNWISGFSPHDNLILYVSKQTGNLDVWFMSIDGSGKTQVTNSEASDYYPVFLPDSAIEITRSIYKQKYPDFEYGKPLD